MSLKKKAEIKTGKIIRELMLADQDVTASTIMVYSKNGINEEIKIEGLHSKSNEDLFLSGQIDWNDKVIYKIVDFSGKAEVGKVTVLDVKKNNITLRIDRIMWSKEKKIDDEETELTNENTLKIVANKTSTEEENTYSLKEKTEQNIYKASEKPKLHSKSKTDLPKIQMEPEPIEIAAVSQQLSNKFDEQAFEHIELQESKNKENIKPIQIHTAPKDSLQILENSKMKENYNRLITKSIAVCQDYALGLDVNNSIDCLKEELHLQGVELPLDSYIMEVVNNLRELKGKGMDLQKLLSLV